MNQALIIYLLGQKKQAARQDVESMHAAKLLEIQATATFL